tara:strand:+ start:153 stop:311 length:159 start_codon:yes stop_codon:yes gene_type:complete
MPTIERVPEPTPAKKAPVAGYDVKTLKKQVGFLQAVRAYFLEHAGRKQQWYL